MMDDVVGLVMVQVISNLGGDNFGWVTVVRPVLVSIAFAVVVPVACLLVLKPTTLRINIYREAHPTAGLDSLLSKTQTAFVFHTALLVGLVAGATYAGTSNLFAAYIAGATISWWDSELPHPAVHRSSSQTPVVKNETSKASADAPGDSLNGKHVPGDTEDSIQPAPGTKTEQGAGHTAGTQSAHASSTSSDSQNTSGSAIYHRYYHPAVTKILQPLFFASIGFSIPIARMFRGAIVWRGIVYTVLMAFAKVICGLWLVRFSSTPDKGNTSRLLAKVKLPSVPHFWGNNKSVTKTTQTSPDNSTGVLSSNMSNPESRSSPNPPKPFSLHPPLILALAMCARGEIGFLISGVAESNGIFSPSDGASTDSSDIFLVVTWAIVLCTIVGPLGVGLSVRRVKELQERKDKQQEGAGREVLGVWGVE